MNIRLIPLCLGLLVFSLITACSSIQVDHKATADLSKMKVIFVERRLNDNHGIDLLIVEELKKLGREVSVGPLTMMPENADAVIGYDDDWTFDFTTHLTGLQIRVRDARKEIQVASGSFYQRAVTRDAPADVVHRVVAAVFASK